MKNIQLPDLHSDTKVTLSIFVDNLIQHILPLELAFFSCMLLYLLNVTIQARYQPDLLVSGHGYYNSQFISSTPH